jgi:hypothetical protein
MFNCKKGKKTFFKVGMVGANRVLKTISIYVRERLEKYHNQRLDKMGMKLGHSAVPDEEIMQFKEFKASY